MSVETFTSAPSSSFETTDAGVPIRAATPVWLSLALCRCAFSLRAALWRISTSRMSRGKLPVPAGPFFDEFVQEILGHGSPLFL